MNIIYQPIKILNILTLPEPSTLALYLLFSLTALGSFYTIIKTKSFIATMSFTGFIVVQTIFNSYQKTDHGFTSLIYLGFILCLFLFRKKEVQKSSNLAITIISLCYFQCGMEKIPMSELFLECETHDQN